MLNHSYIYAFIHIFLGSGSMQWEEHILRSGRNVSLMNLKCVWRKHTNMMKTVHSSDCILLSNYVSSADTGGTIRINYIFSIHS